MDLGSLNALTGGAGLALAGVGAALVAAWQQVKLVFGYISGIAIVRAKFNDQISADLIRYLKHDWRPLPGGVLHYSSGWATLRGQRDSTLIPFRVTPRKAIWWRGPRILISSGSPLTLATIRGLVDFDKLVTEAVRHRMARLQEFSSTTQDSRFSVQRIMGMEKGRYRGDEPQRAGGLSQPGVSPSDVGSHDFEVHHPEDRSFMFAETDFADLKVKDTSFNGLFYPPDIMAYVEECREWLGMAEWYSERGIPWRKGALLHGAGGTGKSSLAKAMAKLLGIPICQYVLPTLSDQEFLQAWERMEAPCIALLEDIDTVWHGRENVTQHKSLNFDTVLNAVSGVNDLQGIFLIVTTNHIDKVDPALGVAWRPGLGISTRPGRIDKVIELGHIDVANKRRMAGMILKDWPDEAARVVAESGDLTPAQFQEMCLQAAYARIHGGGARRLAAA
jgi:hypothetical protein